MERMQRLLSSSTEEEQQAAMLQLQVMMFSRDAFGPESIRQLTVSATVTSCRSCCSAGPPSSSLGWSPSGSSSQMFPCAAPHQQAVGGQAALWPESAVLTCFIALAQVMTPHGGHARAAACDFQSNCRAFFVMQPAELTVYAVQSDYVSHLVMIPGIVTAAAKPKVSSQASAAPACLLTDQQYPACHPHGKHAQRLAFTTSALWCYVSIRTLLPS